MAKALVKEEGDLDFLSLKKRVSYLTRSLACCFDKNDNLEKVDFKFERFY